MAKKSFDPLAKASATSIVFKQKNNEQSAIARQEIIALVAQYQTGKTGITANVPLLATGVADDEGVRFGFGSPIHLACKKLFPRNGNGAKVPVYIVPLADDGSAISATGEISANGDATKNYQMFLTYRETEVEACADACGKIATNAQLNPAKAPRGIDLNNFNIVSVPISIASGTTADDTIDAIIAELDERPDVPFTYSKSTTTSGDPNIEFVSKWKGSDANTISLTIEDSDGNDITSGIYGTDITYAGMSGGSGNSDNETALDNLTEDFKVTRLVSQQNDDTSLDQIQAWGEAFRDGQISQFAVAYHGYEYPESGSIAGTVDVDALITLADTRSDDAVNIMIGGIYGDSLRQLTYAQRDQLLKKGISNIVKQSLGNFRLMDIVTFYHVTGVQNSIFAFDRDLCVLGNIANDLRYVFEYSEEWKSVILVSDSDITDNPDARSENDIKGAVNSRLDFYAKSAWLTDIEVTKEATVVEIDDLNPNRVNINIDGKLSGVLRISDITNSLGFYFGS